MFTLEEKKAAPDRKIRKSGDGEEKVTVVGYSHLRDALRLSAFAIERPAIIGPVKRVMAAAVQFVVPAQVAPKSDHPLDHLLFAFKHEGTNLQVASEALLKIPPADLVSELRRTPNGAYIRKACYLWEALTRQQLQDLPAVGGPTIQVFDPARYLTVPAKRDARWRVAFNGLGSMAYCASVDRTPALEAALAVDVVGRAVEFTSHLGDAMLDRALAWAYLSETEDSFAIERQSVSPDKAEAFVQLLRQAHDARPLSEDYLVQLQNSCMTHPLSRELQFRTAMNWLRGPSRGAMGVTYVPQPPELAFALMQELMPLAARLARSVDAVTAASLVSFAFVFLHPFMDGNGRLSRFLFHHTLCASGRMPNGLLLPVSTAMKRNEGQYLAALRSFSAPARDRWRVTCIDEGRYTFDFAGSDIIYRYWDATACVEFGHRMAEQALEHDLRGETQFLMDYDRVWRDVNERFDIRGKDLVTMLKRSFEQGGRVSLNTRKQFAEVAPSEAFDYIESAVRATLLARGDGSGSDTGTADDRSSP